jgi:hypothetical protein
MLPVNSPATEPPTTAANSEPFTAASSEISLPSQTSVHSVSDDTDMEWVGESFKSAKSPQTLTPFAEPSRYQSPSIQVGPDLLKTLREALKDDTATWTCPEQAEAAKRIVH